MVCGHGLQNRAIGVYKPKPQKKLEQAKFIQDENIFILIGVELFLLALIYWFYRNYRKVKERDYDNSAEDNGYGYRRMTSWRLYGIIGVIFIILSLELIKRLINTLN